MRGLGVVLIVFLTCNGQKKGVENAHVSGNGQLVLLVQDAFFPTDSLQTQVIRDTKTLTTFFRTVNKTRKPGLPVPLVDFDNEMVLVACLGKMKGNIVPELKIKEENQDQLVVSIAINKTSSTTSMVTYPFYVYKMPKTDVPVSFRIEKSAQE
ncbi:MAG: hypothetical protein AAF717_12150 [Bacteroidota bacterium]